MPLAVMDRRPGSSRVICSTRQPGIGQSLFMLRSMGSDASSFKPQPRPAQSTQRAGEPLRRGRSTIGLKLASYGIADIRLSFASGMGEAVKIESGGESPQQLFKLIRRERCCVLHLPRIVPTRAGSRAILTPMGTLPLARKAWKVRRVD